MKTPDARKSSAGDPTAQGSETAVQAAETEEEATKPEPEPWTPERVLEWNAYYDLFVVGFALLLCFLAAATQIDNSTLWTHLRAGELIQEQGAPITTEPFSYAAEGRRWVNVSWLFEWASFQVYELAQGMKPSFLGDEELGRPPWAPDVFASGVLVGLAALLRALAAGLLVMIRRPGPGLWWSAVMATLALGVIVEPLAGDGLPIRAALGGIVGRGGTVSPATWGLVLLAFQLLVMHWAFNLGRRSALFLLVPLFALWANIDASFGVGLLFLAAVVLGSSRYRGSSEAEPAKGEPRRPAWWLGLAVVLLCGAACLANPSTYRVFDAAFGPLVDVVAPRSATMTQDQLTLLPFGTRGEQSRGQLGEAYAPVAGYHLVLVCLGLGSFLLNWRRMDLGRLFLFLTAAVLATMLLRLRDPFALAWAAVIALNGQEWYQDIFGTRGKLGVGWRAWSVGGRLATLLVFTAAILICVTGYGHRYPEPPFGFSADPDTFAFEAADALRDVKDQGLEGRVMNLRLGHGDAINWRAYPDVQPFLDTRASTLYPDLVTVYDQVLRALTRSEPDVWRPILDEWNVSMVTVAAPDPPLLRNRLMVALDASPAWIPFYDDGAVLFYGRLDPSVPEADRAYFEANTLDAEAIVFDRGSPVRSYNRSPRTVGTFDRIFQARTTAPPQPHVKAASRWLDQAQSEAVTAEPSEVVAEFLRAIQEARNALSIKPDDPDAFYLLAETYGHLATLENRILAAGGDTDAASGRLSPPVRIRVQQRLTALNAFVRTAPPPVPSASNYEYVRDILRDAHLEIATLYQSFNYLDLARDHLAEAVEIAGDFDQYETDVRQMLMRASQGAEDLSIALDEIQAQIEQAEIEQQVDPVQLADFAEQQGAVGLAIQLLEEAESSGISLANVRWRLVDLLCDIGRPDIAEQRHLGQIGNEPSLNTGPGTDVFRQGRVYFLLGAYDVAADLWRQAIGRLRASRSFGALDASQTLLRGNPMVAVQSMLNVPNQVLQEAEWQYILGLARLEGGRPQQAGPAFQDAVELNPDIQARPIIVAYLDRLGLEVPEPGAEAEADQETESADSAENANSETPAERDKETETADSEQSADKDDSQTGENPEASPASDDPDV